MKYSTILLDFDGTVADTEKVTLTVFNELAPEFGFRPVSQNEIPHLKTLSARELLTQRLGIPLWHMWKIATLEKRGRDEILKHAHDIVVFSGIREAIEGAHAAGYRVGILSSNSEALVRQVLSESNISVDFIEGSSRVLGKTAAIRKALRKYRLTPAHALYVGDELRDVEASKKAGIDMIAVGWGFNDSDSLRKSGVQVVEQPSELVQFLLSHAA